MPGYVVHCHAFLFTSAIKHRLLFESTLKTKMVDGAVLVLYTDVVDGRCQEPFKLAWMVFDRSEAVMLSIVNLRAALPPLNYAENSYCSAAVRS